MREPRLHPDQHWSERLEERGTRYGAMSDVCIYCPHIRGLHAPEGGCTATVAHLFAPAGEQCECTNRGTGSLYRVASAKCLRPEQREGT